MREKYCVCVCVFSRTLNIQKVGFQSDRRNNMTANFFEDSPKAKDFNSSPKALDRMIAVILTHYNYANAWLSISGG